MPEAVEEPEPFLGEGGLQLAARARPGRSAAPAGRAPRAATPRSGRPARPASASRRGRAAAARLRRRLAPARRPAWRAASGRPARRSCRRGPTAANPQQRRPDAGQQLLRRARLAERLGLAALLLRRRQRPAVDLAVCGERQARRDAPRPTGSCTQAAEAPGKPVAPRRQERARGLHTPPGACLRSRLRGRARPPSRTAGCAARAASISPSSMRKPRILTCWSIRPRNSICPSRATSGRGRRWGRAGRPARRSRDRERSAPPSAPAAPDSRGPGHPRPQRAAPPRRPAPGAARRPGHRRGCWRSGCRSARFREPGNPRRSDDNR